MKTVCFSILFLLLACSFGEGLKCNHCLGKGCRNKVVTCTSDQNACISAIFLPPATVNYFKRCSSKSECEILGTNPSLINVRCCHYDQCNI
uniref:UPAR/Ly6 domain-containing protein n=1 Tax=Esox lucius TaxID=8010 RepID=A0AAY5K2S3_ESOLU